jgi:two-component system cell cycle sensor histidine kinase/response regulator CckA
MDSIATDTTNRNWTERAHRATEDASPATSEPFRLVDQLAGNVGADPALIAELSRCIIEHVQDVIGILDERHVILSVSPAIEPALGYKASEFIGRNALEFVHPTHREAFDAMLTGLSSRGALALLELRLQHRDGSWRTVEARSTSSCDRDEGRLRVVTFRDITTRKSLEAQLRQARRMESLGRLASGVAHDFNNILTALLSWSECLLSGLPAEDPQRPVAEEISLAARRATSLTRQLLAFSRQRPPQSQVLDLNRCVSDLCVMLRRLIGSDVELVTMLAPTAGSIRADPAQIEQLILNLVINARDAMPTGGQLTIQSHHVVISRASDGSNVRPGDYVRLAVSDTGCGMSTETKARIFEPYFTTKEEGHGTGLGLATVYGIVMQQEGAISVDSSPGEGATFTIYLPRIGAAPETAALTARE